MTIAGIVLLWMATRGDAIATPDLFGPLVYWIEAEIWGAAVATASGLVSAGLIWRKRALVVIGAICGLVIVVGFAAMSQTARFGALVWVFSFPLASFHAYPLAQALRDMVYGRD